MRKRQAHDNIDFFALKQSSRTRQGSVGFHLIVFNDQLCVHAAQLAPKLL